MKISPFGTNHGDVFLASMCVPICPNQLWIGHWLTKFKRINKFQTFLILEAKLADESLSNFWRFKEILGNSTTWRNKGARKKIFVGCYAPWLKDDIYAVTNIGAEILMYIQIFIRVKVTFFVEGIHQSSLVSKETKQDRYFDEASQKSGYYFK